MAVNGVSQQLSDMMTRFTFLRTGIVTEQIDPFAATVNVGGTLIRAAYVRQSKPVSGDVVAVLRQNSTWFIVGTTTSSGDNLVSNPSFEDLLTDGSTPSLWTLYQVSGNSGMTAPIADDAVDGDRVIEVTAQAGGAGTSIVYSAPIAVTAGQVIEISAYANGFYNSDDSPTNDLTLLALWFANETDLYPTTSAADSTIDTETNIPEQETMRIMSGTVTVPGAGVYLRVGLRTAVSAAATGTGAHYDFITARVQ